MSSKVAFIVFVPKNPKSFIQIPHFQNYSKTGFKEFRMDLQASAASFKLSEVTLSHQLHSNKFLNIIFNVIFEASEAVFQASS